MVDTVDLVCVNYYLLVFFRHPSKKYEFVSWDDDIPNKWKNKFHVPNHQPDYHWITIKSSFSMIPAGETHAVPALPRSRHPKNSNTSPADRAVARTGAKAAIWWADSRSSWQGHHSLVVEPPLKNMSSSDWIIIPTIGENKSHVPNHQPNHYMCIINMG